MALKDVLKEARLKKNLKQEDAARLVKVTVQTYSKWENGKTEPKASQVGELSRILGVSTDDICKGKRSVKLDTIQFIKAYETLTSGMTDIGEIILIHDHIEDDKEFLNAISEYDGLPIEVLNNKELT
jgi:transcriptional regulator with XRE-family HTH domain